MEKIIRKFEKGIVLVLLVMMMLAILLSTIELGVLLIQQFLHPPRFLLDINELLEVFGFFLLVLIGLELLKTVQAYLKNDEIHVEVVFLVAIIAVARKVIIFDYKSLTPQMLLGIAAILLALSAGFYMIKKTFKPSTIGKLGNHRQPGVSEDNGPNMPTNSD
ncbi:MAG: phosphate-starvation-inducible E-like protein [Actinobacteria bacterium]|nr:phosphate-starvation-inducible E-like protein [Actinomycetota bacterium]